MLLLKASSLPKTNSTQLFTRHPLKVTLCLQVLSGWYLSNYFEKEIFGLHILICAFTKALIDFFF